MRDLFEQIQNNNTERLGKRRKPNKGSKLARYALKEAMGGDELEIGGGFYGSDQIQLEDLDLDLDLSNDFDFENI